MATHSQVFRLANADTKRNIEDYRQICLLRHRNMARQLNGSIAWESKKAYILQTIDQTATTLVEQSNQNVKSIETYLKKKAAKRTFVNNEVKGLLSV